MHTGGTLAFAPGETEKTAAMALLDDAIDEGKERFTPPPRSREPGT